MIETWSRNCAAGLSIAAREKSTSTIQAVPAASATAPIRWSPSGAVSGKRRVTWAVGGRPGDDVSRSVQGPAGDVASRMREPLPTRPRAPRDSSTRPRCGGAAPSRRVVSPSAALIASVASGTHARAVRAFVDADARRDRHPARRECEQRAGRLRHLQDAGATGRPQLDDALLRAGEETLQLWLERRAMRPGRIGEKVGEESLGRVRRVGGDGPVVPRLPEEARDLLGRTLGAVAAGAEEHRAHRVVTRHDGDADRGDDQRGHEDGEPPAERTGACHVRRPRRGSGPRDPRAASRASPRRADVPWPPGVRGPADTADRS